MHNCNALGGRCLFDPGQYKLLRGNAGWDEELITKAKEVIPIMTYSEFFYPADGQKPIRSYLDPSLKFEL